MGRVSMMIVVGIVISLGLAACGGSGSSNQEELARAKRQAANHVHKEDRLRRLEKELKQVHKGSGSGSDVTTNSAPSPAPPPPQSSRSSCGGSLSVGPDTTCEFAENVELEYEREMGSGSGSVVAYSPANNETYDMFCTAAPHECSGAIDATVFFP